MKSLKHKFQKNVLILSITITSVFLVINISLYVISNNFLINKIQEENNAFLEITTHIMNENDVAVALEYVEHYTHIHKVDIEVLDEDDNMLFSSNISHRYANQYTIETLQGDFTIFIDNTDSVTVTAVEKNTLIVNLSLLAIYIISLIIFVRGNKISADLINNDIKMVLQLIDEQPMDTLHFTHTEFKYIYEVINQFLEDIDLLTEQRELNMKGIAHDIKTPLTIIYSYFTSVQKNEVISEEQTKAAFESAQRINELLNDIIDNNQNRTYKTINITSFLEGKIEEYQSVFSHKNISFTSEIEQGVALQWNEKDFSRVLGNLLSNAYYYSKENSLVKIILRKQEKVMIEITSEPIEMTALQVEKIFKKGYRNTATRDYNIHGKGYGLYLAKLLVQYVGGTIEATSIDNNVKFTIYL